MSIVYLEKLNKAQALAGTCRRTHVGKVPATDSQGGEVMCEYCNGDENTQQPLPDNEEATVWTICKDKIEIVTISRQLQVFSCNINYCPMCGRKLTEDK